MKMQRLMIATALGIATSSTSALAATFCSGPGIWMRLTDQVSLTPVIGAYVTLGASVFTDNADGTYFLANAGADGTKNVKVRRNASVVIGQTSPVVVASGMGCGDIGFTHIVFEADVAFDPTGTGPHSNGYVKVTTGGAAAAKQQLSRVGTGTHRTQASALGIADIWLLDGTHDAALFADDRGTTASLPATITIPSMGMPNVFRLNLSKGYGTMEPVNTGLPNVTRGQ
ncbi:MAG: hypothetical protein HYV07_31030 [Deltaproteobacteria bacterium]|nr:hypothetical protein [Deltaproteobacteria bacterium]